MSSISWTCYCRFQCLILGTRCTLHLRVLAVGCSFHAKWSCNQLWLPVAVSWETSFVYTCRTLLFLKIEIELYSYVTLPRWCEMWLRFYSTGYQSVNASTIHSTNTSDIAWNVVPLLSVNKSLSSGSITLLGWFPVGLLIIGVYSWAIRWISFSWPHFAQGRHSTEIRSANCVHWKEGFFSSHPHSFQCSSFAPKAKSVHRKLIYSHSNHINFINLSRHHHDICILCDIFRLAIPVFLHHIRVPV